MTIQDLKKLFKEKDVNELVFSGKCHDCGRDVEVKTVLLPNGEVEISGGAVYYVDEDGHGTMKYFLKCDECYKKDEILRNFRKTEVYSRSVGYLRPLSQWNEGKREEFKERKNFKIE